MTDEKLTATEVSESLTGYDEIGIAKAFGEIESLKGNMPARALAFVLSKREGKTHDEAYEAAMSLSAKALGDVFADEDDEVIPDEPVTDAGKDDSSPAIGLVS